MTRLRPLVLLAASALIATLVVAASGGEGTATPAGVAPSVSGVPHTVSWDSGSFMIDGKRTFIWSGEFHYWRLPSPTLWRDVLEKMKADGMNAASIYFDWGFHSPAPGVFDFSGIRDVDRLLTIAEQVGIYVLARPGPYINAETDSGGFPGWLDTQKGTARTTAPDYTVAYRDWLHHIDPILARHQITRGGSIIAVQAENEYTLPPSNDPTYAAYMQDIQDTFHADGLVVPTFHNDLVPVGTWAQGPGHVDMYAADNYPVLFDCSNPDNWNGNLTAVPETFEANSRKADPTDPVFLAEYQGGSFDPWGGPGYDQCRKLTSPAFQKVFDKTAVAQAATLINTYMTYGGTSWGWLPYPGVYTSYDYAAAIAEDRSLTPKYDEMKRMGYLFATVEPLRDTLPTGPAPADNPAVAYRQRANPATGTQFTFLRHLQVQSTTDDTAHLALNLPDGVYPQIPQQAGTAIHVNGRDAKIFVESYDLGAQRLVYSTSELLTHVAAAGRDVAVLYGRAGEDGETVLRYGSRPTVQVLSGSVTGTWDATRGDLRLNYTHASLAKVLVTGGGRRPLLLEIGDDAAAATFWRSDTGRGTTLLSDGPYLVRAATTDGTTIALRGDTSAPGPLEIFPQGSERLVTWNGAKLAVSQSASGSLVATLPGPVPVTLPSIGTWRYSPASPETAPGFDDSSWTVADHMTTNNPTAPVTTPVLYMDDYGFHHGMVWYRGHFVATGTETGITLDGRGGLDTKGASYSAWINGRFLGTAGGKQTFSFGAGSLRPGSDNVVSLLLENIGHDEDGISNDSHKSPRGFVQAALQGSAATPAWRIQGNLGGESGTDPVRGVMNGSGLFGERHGWYLPGFDDSAWTRVTLPTTWGASQPDPGVAWYRTSIRLDLPANQDVPVSVRVADDPARAYKAEIYVNGWLVGRYWNNVGPQHDFPVPAGVLNPRASNQISIAVWALNASGRGLGAVSLVSTGNYLTGAP